ncbi:radical SAM protein [Nannocystis pusilla]|uniref:radical SAM protein n=1 Tax=Nannocystis pusilla TaxID=889268 RepID=UPI003B798B77
MPRPIDNPPNPWLSTHVEYFGEPPPAGLEVFEEDARSVVSTNDSPDIPFRYSVNPYRGCYHGCAYCYARPTHQYLGWGAGTDFERKIVAKVNAPALLRQFLARSKWTRELLAFSGVTDCYQPLEAHYGLTRGCLEACLEFANPVGIITKGPLVARDVDLLAELNRRAGASVTISIPFIDDAMARRIEPSVARPSKRFQALATLSAAGIRTGVAVAPVIPGLNDSQIPQILARARECGRRMPSSPSCASRPRSCRCSKAASRRPSRCATRMSSRPSATSAAAPSTTPSSAGAWRARARAGRPSSSCSSCTPAASASTPIRRACPPRPRCAPNLPPRPGRSSARCSATTDSLRPAAEHRSVHGTCPARQVNSA